MIVQGTMILRKGDKGIGLLSKQYWFGERALFLENLVHNMTVRCETECEFLVLTRDNLMQKLALFPTMEDEYYRLLDEIQSVSVEPTYGQVSESLCKRSGSRLV